MLGASGRWMNRARGDIDWVRYFTLDHAGAKTLPPTGPASQERLERSERWLSDLCRAALRTP